MRIPKAQERIYLRQGQAISAWQLVETELCRIFEVAADTSDRRTAEVIFYAAVSFSTKLDIVHAAVLSRHLSEGTKTQWTGLKKRVLQLYSQRNAIAHNPLFAGLTKSSRDKFYLAPALNRSKPNKPPKEYSHTKIKQAAVDFEKLALSLCRFRKNGLWRDTRHNRPNILE